MIFKSNAYRKQSFASYNKFTYQNQAVDGIFCLQRLESTSYKFVRFHKPMLDHRHNALQYWITQTLKNTSFELTPLAGDASFRRYFRVQLADRTLVAMDAPPDRENSRPFVAIATAFAQQGIQVPEILASDLNQGFILLSDFGDHLYLNLLNANNVDLLYEKALNVLPRIQACQQNITDWPLSHFNEAAIQRELALFPEWFLCKHLNFTTTASVEKLLTDTFSLLTQSAIEQPQLCVHRDYHSRNLLLLEDGGVGVLDFQDAVWGPITYDLVSILRDCYIAWPQQQVEKWALNFYEQINLKKHSQEQFLRWFDFMGIQRHVKVLGIFSRLCHRDNKPNYLNDLPRIMNYLLEACEKYSELKSFRNFLQTL